MLHYTTVTVKSCWRLCNAIWRRLIFYGPCANFLTRHCGNLGNAGLVHDTTKEEGLKVENVKLHANVRNVEGRLAWWLGCGLRSFGKPSVEEKMALMWSDVPETFFTAAMVACYGCLNLAQWKHNYFQSSCQQAQVLLSNITSNSWQ